MIDFRYHLVSIIAVFLALAVGIVVGSVGLRPAVGNTLTKEVHNAEKANSALNAQNNQLKRQITADQAFAQAAETSLVKNLLTGQRVVLVTAPGADTSTVTGIKSALTEAGATATGIVNLAPQFFQTDATTEQTLAAAAVQFAPPGVGTTDTAGAQIAGQQAAAKVIAAAIMDKLGASSSAAGQTNRILTGFGDGNFLQVSNTSGGASNLSGQATLAVVVTPATAPASAGSLSPENLALVYLTHYLQQWGNAAVLAGSLQGSGTGSAIDAVTSGGAGVAVTTVDNADSATGQIIVAQALRTMLDHPGLSATAYGVGPASAPSPAPTSSATPSPTSTPKTKKKTVKR